MKKWSHPREYLKGFEELVLRFPVTIGLFLIITFDIIRTIGGKDPSNPRFYSGLIITALLTAIGQLFYERFYYKEEVKRWLIQGGAVVLGILYYIYLRIATSGLETYEQFYSVPGIRTMIVVFTLMILFIWVPVIKSERTFEESFLAVFKAHYISLFFTLVLFIGVMIVFGLFELLITSLNIDWLAYTGAIVFTFFLPTFYLSLIPDYRSDKDTGKGFEAPKLLRNLISWILVPIMTIYSAIIILYIFINISGDFFNESLLEPLFLTYAIGGWVILILSNAMDQKAVQWFKKIFPLLLLVVVVFQMIASIIQIGEVGITHGRYIILLFGLASLVSGVWYIISKQQLYFFPAVTVIAGVIAFMPPIDALTVSVHSQINRMESVLEANNMLEDDVIIAKEDVTEEDQKAILESVRYLSGIHALNKVSYIPDDFSPYAQNIPTLFGFGSSIDDDNGYTQPTWVSLRVNENEVTGIPVEDYEHLIPISLPMNDNRSEARFTQNRDNYSVTIHHDDEIRIEIKDSSGQRVNETDFSYLLNEWDLGANTYLTVPEATFIEEGENFKVGVVIRQMTLHEDGDLSLDMYLLIGSLN